MSLEETVDILQVATPQWKRRVAMHAEEIADLIRQPATIAAGQFETVEQKVNNFLLGLRENIRRPRKQEK